MDNDWEYSVTWTQHGHSLLVDHKEDMADFTTGLTFLEVGSDRGEGSTKVLAELALSLGMKFVTVDMDDAVSDKVRPVVEAVHPEFMAICAKGEDYILTLPDNSIAVAYLDAYDTMPPDRMLPADMAQPYSRLGGWKNHEAWRMHLIASMALDFKLVPGGLLCFDDTWRKNGVWASRSKGYMALPWLLANGYREVAYVDGSILLRKWRPK